MASLYLGIILLCRIVQAIFSKRTSLEVKNISTFVHYNSFSALISAALGLILIFISQNRFKADFLTVIIAAFSGISLTLSSFCGLYAMKSGTVAMSSMFGTAGMILPVLAGIFLFNTPVTPVQWAGMLLFFVSAWLLIGSSKQIYSNFSFKTMLLLFGTLFSNGCTMLAQQMFTAYVPNGDVTVFSFLSFGIIAVLSSIFSLFIFIKENSKKNAKTPSGKFPKILIICVVASAVAVFIINQLATISTALVSPIILFTFINGGGTIISTIVAAIMYREKLSLRTLSGVCIGILSLIIIKMF